jgi:hypothetical protein
MTYSLDTQAMRELRGALPDDTTPASTNTWAPATDGSSAPRLLAPLAYSPAVVRR